MKLTRTLLWAALPLLAAGALADEPKKPAPPEGGMTMPQPGPEHQMLAKDAGTWDATVESWMAPGEPPSTSKGVETSTMIGGLWLLTDFKSEFMSQPFQGHGVMGYDPAKKKFVGTWVDSMAPALYVTEASYDAQTKTMTGYMDGPGPDGKPMRMKEVTEWPDSDTRVFTMYSTTPEGRETAAMRITYKRRK